MTNNTVTVIVSSKYLQINKIHDIRERFIILVVCISGAPRPREARTWAEPHS